MDKLRSMNSKQLGIFTAIVVAVLGVVGVLSGEMILQIVIAAVQALIIIWVMTQIVSGGTSEKKASDKYRKLFMNLPIGFAQAEIITDGAGDAVGYKVVDEVQAFAVVAVGQGVAYRVTHLPLAHVLLHLLLLQKQSVAQVVAGETVATCQSETGHGGVETVARMLHVGADAECAVGVFVALLVQPVLTLDVVGLTLQRLERRYVEP